MVPPKWLRMTRNSQFCPICNFSNLFPLKWLRMTRSGQFHLIHNFSNLFPMKWLRMTQNSQICPIHNFSNLFSLKWLKMTLNNQFCLIHNFSDLFLLKWLKMTQNGQFGLSQLLQSFPTEVAHRDSEQPNLPDLQLFHIFSHQMIDLGWIKYQTQIVTKLPNENIQNYQLQIIDWGGGGKPPNANCDQTTK